MTIEFRYNHSDQYLEVTYIGKMQPGEILAAWAGFFKTRYQGLGYNILSDISQADFSLVSMAELDDLSTFTAENHKKYGIDKIKVANDAPPVLRHGHRFHRTDHGFTGPGQGQGLAGRRWDRQTGRGCGWEGVRRF